MTAYRLTQYASGGGCACKIPPGELEEVVRGLTGHRLPDLLVGLDDGDDAAVVRIDDRTAVVATADFFTPVVDDAYDWGRIAAANALSDVYAMGGRRWSRSTWSAGRARSCRRSCSRGAARRQRRGA
jgi:selenide,water dikinase